MTTSGQAGRALVVEDDPVCRVYLTHLLSNLGYQVDTAGDDQEAFHHVSRRRYKVVTLDGHLPGADGPSVYRTMTSQGWLGKDTQVLIVSGDDDLWTSSVSSDDTHLHLVGKPVCPDTVANILKNTKESEAPFEVPRGWDEERVRALEALGPEAARMLFETFSRSVPEVLSALDHAVLVGDPTSVRALADQVKGAAASVGARGLAYCAGALETAAEEGLGGWEKLLNAIRVELKSSTDDMRARQQQYTGVIS